MLSMTGFGSGEATTGAITVMIELRSVNHRFLDVSLKLPGSLAVYEGDIRKFLKDHVARGRVTVMAQLQSPQDQEGAGLDLERLAEGLAMVRQVAAALEKETGTSQPITLDHLLSVPRTWTWKPRMSVKP
jgi:uncharacterized protein (TIGR00255 family)